MEKTLFLIFFLVTGSVFSQLGFCPGSKGDPIFHESFGSGSGTGVPLPAGVTNYTYVVGDPNDGEYTISSEVGQNNGSWHPAFPGTTISNGKALVVNAGMTPGKFFETTISGLCEATTYEFSAFLISVYDTSSNVCEDGGIPLNVRFQIWDQTNTNILAEGDTGDIPNTATAQWVQKALTFRSQPGQHEVILKMFNNGAGGCGNDLAIDDIVFRSCGDLTEVVSASVTGSTQKVCREDTPAVVELTASPDGSVYNSHYFQWQQSFDEVSWQDLPGENARTYTNTAISETTFFRVKVAEDAVNLNDNFCSSASEPFAVLVAEIPNAPQSEGDVSICEGDPIPALEVTAETDETVNWFESPAGEELLGSGTSFIPPAAGTYYAESVKTGFDCTPSQRTPINFTVFERPEVKDEVFSVCQGSVFLLDAGAGNFTYQWNTGENSQEIRVAQPGTYTVEVTNAEGCSATKNFEVRAADVPDIAEITSEDTSVKIELTNAGTFEYSLDGINFQLSNVFLNVPGGIYTAYVRDLNACKTVSKEFPHLVIPQFITPNNDGWNDHFELRGVEFFESSEIRIFDRYGKLLAVGRGEDFSWDGTLNGMELPAADYWYHIFIAGFEPVKGHFTLKR